MTTPQSDLHHLVRETPNRVELGQIARELGYFLPRASLPELRSYRAEVAEVRDHPEMERPEKAFVQGVLFTMGEVCASYESEIQAEAERRQTAAYGAEKPLHNALLHRIFAGTTSPSDLAEALGKDHGQISRALTELRSAGLIELVTPSRLGDQRKRFYRLTTEGLRILGAQGWQASPGEPKDMVDIEIPGRHASPGYHPLKLPAPKVRAGARPAYPSGGRAHAAGTIAS
jgi:DNA-binding transcriptional ArsR family regulator